MVKLLHAPFFCQKNNNLLNKCEKKSDLITNYSLKGPLTVFVPLPKILHLHPSSGCCSVSHSSKSHGEIVMTSSSVCVHPHGLKAPSEEDYSDQTLSMKDI